MRAVRPRTISSTRAVGAVDEPATKGGSHIVLGAFFTFLGEANIACREAGRVRALIFGERFPKHERLKD